MFSDRFEREQVFLLFESALKLPDGTKIDDPITECLRRVEVLAVSLKCHGPKGKNSTCEELTELAVLLEEASEASNLRYHWPRIYDLLREFEPAWQLIETQHRLSVRPRPGKYKELDGVIEKIVRENPKISAKALFSKLETLAESDHDVIHRADGDTIEFRGRFDKLHPIKLEALGIRLTRIKTKVSPNQ